MARLNSTILLSLSQLRFVCLFSIVLIFFLSSSKMYAQVNDSTLNFTPLSGTLPSFIKAENSPYVVETDIFVSPGTKVTIDSGVVLLFNNFTGLHIQGTLYALGTKDQPIVFTSKNDTYYNPYATISAAPYDWNGIDIYENAIGSYFKNCSIQFTVYGIRSQTEHFKILNSRFLQNGKSDVLIRENLLNVEDSPFTYNASVPESNSYFELTPTLSTHDYSVKKQHSKFKHFLRYSGLICALGGITAGAIELREFSKVRNKFNSINQTNDNNLQTYTSKDWDSARNDLSNKTTILETCGGISLLGLVTFGISFTF